MQNKKNASYFEQSMAVNTSNSFIKSNQWQSSGLDEKDIDLKVEKHIKNARQAKKERERNKKKLKAESAKELEKEIEKKEKKKRDQGKPKRQLLFANDIVPIIKYQEKHQKVRLGKLILNQVDDELQPEQSQIQVSEIVENNKQVGGNNKKLTEEQQELKRLKQKLKSEKQRRKEKRTKKQKDIRDIQEKENKDRVLVLEEANNTYAIGHLIGVNDLGGSVRTYAVFQGNFDGAFEYHGQDLLYFEGKIKQLCNQISLTYKDKQLQQQPFLEYLKKDYSVVNQEQTMDDKQQHLNINDLSLFKGAFKGYFKQIQEIDINKIRQNKIQLQQSIFNIMNVENVDLKALFRQYKPKVFYDQKKPGEEVKSSKKIKLLDDCSKHTKQKSNYIVPALVTFDLKKITQVNLQKSNANISGTLNVDIRLNQEIVTIFKNERRRIYLENVSQKDLQKFTKMTQEQQNQQIVKNTQDFQLTIDFHRGKLMNLPFYKFHDEDEKKKPLIEDEWADLLEGIDHASNWDPLSLIMSYRITTIFTAQINNTHGIFLSPFNVNIIKIIVDFHAIKIGDEKVRIDINCCDLSDSYNNQQYNPYTYFNYLEQNDSQYYEKNINVRFRKHFDRLSKIDTRGFNDTGYYRIADNRMTLFPYYKRVLKNTEYLTRKWSWIFGYDDKQQMLILPQVKSIQSMYQKALNEPTKKYQNFDFVKWEFVHIDIPVFNYAVIDMIRIFIPIIILSSIGLLIFQQENAKDEKKFTTLAKRIASGFSLLIAYIALIPLIRANLPPTPSITLVQILIYISTIPNFLAIISNLTTDSANYQQFFNDYYPFLDGLFLASFLISIISIVIIIVVIVILRRRDDIRKCKFKNYKRATVQSMRSPYFLQFIHDIKTYRPTEYTIQQLKFPRQQLEFYIDSLLVAQISQLPKQSEINLE